ncbi:DUF6188 family protein [Terrabacter sp. 2RAF25]|uniref:DUF6188 family protein n=1 Tax=Terrabacter sp. 2RAF25 TaxID=3232998 RepID=UPI003F94F8DC
MIPDFTRMTVSRVQLDWMVRLWTSGGGQFNLEGDVFVTHRGRPPVQVDISQSVETPPKVLADLLGQEVTGVLVSRTNDLAINLVDAQVSCRVDPAYESWTIHGPHRAMVVCMPGGELAVWSPPSEGRS